MPKTVDQKTVTAKLKYFRVSPRKVRPLLKSLRGKKVVEVVAHLTFNNSRASVYLNKLLKSAISNAKNKGLEEENLIVSQFTCDEGPVQKRFRPGHRGVALPYERKMAHIQVVLTESKAEEKSKVSKSVGKTLSKDKGIPAHSRKSLSLNAKVDAASAGSTAVEKLKRNNG